jgi:anti-anti-sigma factor
VDNDPIYDFIPEGTFSHHEEPLAGGKLVLKLDGELDMFVSPVLTRRLHQIAEDGVQDVVLDLSDARFIDSSVLETFVFAQRELQDHKHSLAVVASGPYTRRTFELAGLSETLCVCGTRDEAVTRLTH